MTIPTVLKENGIENRTGVSCNACQHSPLWLLPTVWRIVNVFITFSYRFLITPITRQYLGDVDSWVVYAIITFSQYIFCHYFCLIIRGIVRQILPTHTFLLLCIVQSKHFKIIWRKAIPTSVRRSIWIKVKKNRVVNRSCVHNILLYLSGPTVWHASLSEFNREDARIYERNYSSPVGQTNTRSLGRHTPVLRAEIIAQLIIITRTIKDDRINIT